MADNYLNSTGLSYYHSRIVTLFAKQTDFNALDAKVDGIISEGGEPNVIDEVKVNGTALVPDAQKAVDVTVPTSTSDLTNDGDGTSNFATEAYVGTHGGKIDSISVNGTAQTIDANKNVNITVPTKVSDIANDSGFQTASDVSGAISTALANGSDPYQTESDVNDAISAAVSSAYTYKGSVATQSALPSSGQKTGDVYDVQDTGMNYAWNGSAWDALGTYVDVSLYWAKSELTAITTAQVDALFA